MRLRSPLPAMLILWLYTGAARVVAQDAGGSSSLGLDLSPQAAARATEGLSEAAPRRVASREPSERDLSEGVPGLVRMNDATLGEKAAYQVNRVVWQILQFWKRPPESRRVRYFYIGRSVDVAIHDDGSYDVRDKRGLIVTVVAAHSLREPGLDPTSNVNEERLKDPRSSPPAAAGVGIGIPEPGRMLQSILTGKEPPNAEMRTFLEATRPLRERLRAREDLRARAAASARMNEELRSIWQVPGPSERKRQDTFALWDHCSEDEIGVLARSQIEAFVRDLGARRGECPYAAADLARLNQKRRSKAPFSPCDAADAGGVSTGAAGTELGALNAQTAGDAGAKRP